MSTRKNGQPAKKSNTLRPHLVVADGQPDLQVPIFSELATKRVAMSKGMAVIIYWPGVRFTDETIEQMQTLGLLHKKPRIDSLIDMPKVKAEFDELQSKLLQIETAAARVRSSLPIDTRARCAAELSTPLPDVTTQHLFDELNKHDLQAQNNIIRQLLQKITKNREFNEEHVKRQVIEMQGRCIDVSKRQLEISESTAELNDILRGK